MLVPVTAEEKTNKKNDVRQEALLLMLFPNEHQHTSVNTVMLKQCLLLSKHDLEAMKPLRKHRRHCVVITQEDLNSKFLRSLPLEWNTHVVVWMNKADIKTMSIDNLYNNFKIVKQDVKKYVGVISTANSSDNTVYAFMVENHNGSNLLQQDLEQIHEDDLEAMDLKYDKSKVSKTHYEAVINKDTSSKAMLANDGFEKVKQEKEGIEFKIEKFDNASKSLNKLLESQITDKVKRLGYNVVPLPHPLIYNRPKKLDLSYSGLDEFKDHEFKSYGSKDIKEQVSEDTSSFVESPLNADKEIVFLVDKKIKFVKPKNHEKPVKKLVMYAEMYRSQSPRGNQRNLNGQKNKSPRAVLLKTGLTTLNTIRLVNTAHSKTAIHSAKLISHFSKQAQSTAQRPFYKQTTLTRRSVHTAKRHYYTKRPRAVNTARLYTGQVNDVREKGGKPQQDDKGFVDSGCSRHMTGNIAYLLDFKEFDGGYVAFGGGAYGGRITVSQMCDKKNYVLFTDTEYLVLSPNFKLPDENQILLKIPRNDNMYSFDMKNLVPKESLTSLVAKATLDESMLWHRRLGHINFKNINKLVKDNLVRGLPIKPFENDQICVAYLKGKQHKASLVTDDYSRFTWVFFLTTKDETSEILKNFIKEIENLVDKKVKIIRSDNGTEFKNKVMDDFCREKGIKREYSVARTPQQNGVAERRNRTLIEAARTMLADSKLPTTFWAEAVSTACYVQNRVLVVKPHNKTPYELFRGFKPALSFMRPFGCHVTILNTLDSLGKFDGKSDEGFFVGYSLSSKAFRVYNTRTRRVEENLHIRFLENKPMIEGNGLKWLFDIDSLTQSMNYVPVIAGTISNDSAGTSEEISQDCIVMLIWKDTSYFDSPTKDVENGKPKTANDALKKVEDSSNNENAKQDKFEDDSSTKDVNAAGQHVNTASLDVNTGSLKLNVVGPSVNTASSNEQDSPKDMFTMGASHTLEATHIEFFSDEDEPEIDLGNITNSYQRITKPTSEQGFLSDVYEQKTHDTLNTCLYACFLSQIEPTSIAKALSDSSWVEAMQEEILQFKLQQVWILVDLPSGKRSIGTKWVFKNKKDERGIVNRNKARIEAIRLFLAYDSFMGFLVYQMDVKSGFLYGTIEEEDYVTQPPGFKDLDHPNKVYKAVKALYGLYQAPRAWYETLANYLLGNVFKRGKIDQTLFIKKQKRDILLVQVYVDDIIFGFTNKELCTGFEKLMKDKFQMSSIGELTFFLGLQVQQKEDGIFISQDKYVAEILKKFNYTDVKSASTPVDLEKPLVKDGDANDVDGFSIELVAYTNSDYVRATQDRKSTTGGCQFLGNKLIYWQCKKQTVVATSTTEAKYVAAARCCGQNQKHLGMSKEVGTPRYLSLVVPLKKVSDEAVHKELGDRMERASTTASCLEAEQDSGSGPRCQDTILGDVDAQTRFEITSKQSNDPPLSRGYTIGSGEDNMKLFELMELCTQLSYKNRKSVLFLLLVYINAAKLMLGLVNAVRRMLMLPVQVPAAEVNPIIYTSCIEQFWATVKVVTVNEVRQLQALVDKKRVLIMESSIRSDLHLDDAEAFFSPQWKYFIHTNTQCLSAKSTAWNEFSSTMASLIICLATNQKFNMSKYIFDAMVKHFDGGVKFLMYLHFLQVFINQQLGDMSHHKKIFVNPFHTKKVFANMKRAGKDFFKRITPLFDTMMVQASEEQKQKSKRRQRKEVEVPQDETEHEESIPTPSNDPQPSGEDSMQLNYLMVLCTKLQARVLDLEKANDAQAKEIAALKKRDDDLMFDTGVLDDDEVFVDVTTVEKEQQSTKIGEAVTTAGVEDTKPNAKGIVFHDQEEQVSVFKPTVSVTQPLVKDKGKGIMQEPERPLTKKDQVAIDEDLARNIQAQLDAEIIE
ncbi:putative ribonuclease H-like domain-containing protein [Tanacetum coccineum]